MKNNKKTIYSALTVVTALLAQLPASAQESADSAQVIFGAVPTSFFRSEMPALQYISERKR